jgi:hypothetical protein
MKIAAPFSLAVALALGASAPAPAAETVRVPAFRSIQLRGGGNLVVRPGPVQRVTILSGSSAFTRVRVERDGQLRIDACNARCPQFYRLTIEIESPSLPDVAVAGGGRIAAGPGFHPQRQLSAAVLGGGEIDTRALEARDASAAVQGGGTILVRAAASLNAAVNGGGSVRYWGNPSVTSAIAGGGHVAKGG